MQAVPVCFDIENDHEWVTRNFISQNMSNQRLTAQSMQSNHFHRHANLFFIISAFSKSISSSSKSIFSSSKSPIALVCVTFVIFFCQLAWICRNVFQFVAQIFDDNEMNCMCKTKLCDDWLRVFAKPNVYRAAFHAECNFVLPSQSKVS